MNSNSRFFCLRMESIHRNLCNVIVTQSTIVEIIAEEIKHRIFLAGFSLYQRTVLIKNWLPCNPILPLRVVQKQRNCVKL